MHTILIRSLIVLTLATPLAAVAYPVIRDTGTVFWNKDQTHDGFTLIVPSGGAAKDQKQAPVFLIDMAGKEVHRWNLHEGLRPTSARLLGDGTLFLVARMNGLDPGIAGSTIQELGWNGEVLWEVDAVDWHHDVARLPNGNIIGFQYEKMPPASAVRVRGGLKNTEDTDGSITQDILVEIDRQTKQPIWTWKPHEHLRIEDFPLGPLQTRKEWTHANSIVYLPDGNPLTTGEGLLISFRQIDLVFAVEKETGAVTWTFGPGETSKQHDATLLDTGDVMIFDNGMHRPGTIRYGVPSSRVITVNTVDKMMTSEYLGNGFNGLNFLSPLWGGAQRLSNGNTLITEGMTGRVFEINQSSDKGTDSIDYTDPRIVWEYINPHVSALPLGRTIAKAIRYTSDSIEWPEELAQDSQGQAVETSDDPRYTFQKDHLLLLGIGFIVLMIGYLVLKRRFA